MRAAEVEHLVALGWTFSSEEIHLVVTVEMIPVGPVTELHALQQFISDVWVTRSSHQGGEPVQPGEDSILDRALLNLARRVTEL
jgi:hypothetical protein